MPALCKFAMHVLLSVRAWAALCHVQPRTVSARRCDSYSYCTAQSDAPAKKYDIKSTAQSVTGTRICNSTCQGIVFVRVRLHQIAVSSGHVLEDC